MPAKKAPAKKVVKPTRKKSAPRGPRSAAQRVSNLLVMLPWLMQRHRVKIPVMARQFGLTEKELIDDLQMASMCGVPPYSPDSLVDVFVDEGYVVAEVPRLFSRPLKLNSAELFAISVMAQAAMQSTGLDKKGPLASALAKLAPLLGSGAETIQVQLPRTRYVKEMLAAVSSAERQEIEYYSPASQRRSTRTITARRVFEESGKWYVAASDSQSGEERVFRIDRIEKLRATGEIDPTIFGQDEELPWFSEVTTRVTLRVEKSARWIVESYPYIEKTNNSDSSVNLTMAITDERWLGRLLLRAGRGVKVIKPARYKQLRQSTAQAVLDRYQIPN